MSRLTCGGHIQHMYSWWWVRLSPETCGVKPLRRIKTQLLHLVGFHLNLYYSVVAGINRHNTHIPAFGWYSFSQKLYHLLFLSVVDKCLHILYSAKGHHKFGFVVTFRILKIIQTLIEIHTNTNLLSAPSKASTLNTNGGNAYKIDQRLIILVSVIGGGGK